MVDTQIVTLRRTHSSFVKYIDKSRDFYAAHGYDTPYAWASNRDVPFTLLPKPLSELRIGVVTTADCGPRVDGRQVRQFAQRVDAPVSIHTDMFWDRDSTHMDDVETFLPLDTLYRHQEAGNVGAMSRRFYGVSTEYSQRLTQEYDAPQIADWMREDDVDVALLVAI